MRVTVGLLAIVLAGCGTSAPAQPTRSAREASQDAYARCAKAAPPGFSVGLAGDLTVADVRWIAQQTGHRERAAFVRSMPGSERVTRCAFVFIPTAPPTFRGTPGQVYGGQTEQVLLVRGRSFPDLINTPPDIGK